MNAETVQQALDIFYQRLHRNESSGFYIIDSRLKTAMFQSDSLELGKAPLLPTEKKLPRIDFHLVDGYMFEGRFWLRYCQKSSWKQIQENPRYKFPGYFSTPASQLLVCSDHNLKTHLESVLGIYASVVSHPLDIVQHLISLGVEYDAQDSQSVVTDMPLLENPDYAHYGFW